MIYYVVSLLSQIYCNGPILKVVQEANLFPDSKHFVDMALRNDPVTTLRNFDELGEKATDPVVLRQFVDANFMPPGSELVEHFPLDWTDFPPNFLRIEDYHMRRWALHLHRIWRDLCRKVRDDVRRRQEFYSLLYVPHPFIIPGGRFREFYYWDTFWIVKGLLYSQMASTAAGVIRNLATMVTQHGFVPNGGRVYYLCRSQPPLLAQMVHDYFLATGDINFLTEMLPVLEKEFDFWVKNRATNYSMEEGSEPMQVFQYRVSMKGPRPESYREDMHLVDDLHTIEEKEKMWSQVAAAAETGWDFSTRWFSQGGENRHKMQTIRTHSIVPVDLNAFMCANARIIASIYEITGDFHKVRYYNKRYRALKKSLHTMHWNETDGIWYDFDIERKVHSNIYYVSNAVPLYARCFDDEEIPHRVHHYLEREGVYNFTKGLPTSLAMGSEQQWDKENAWPPMVHMVIEGFRTTGDQLLMKQARRLAQVWMRATYQSFIRTHAMFEKYNVSATDEAAAGSGGEYEVQTGFGWTNGVILDLLDKYGSDMSSGGSRTFQLLPAIVLVFLGMIF